MFMPSRTARAAVFLVGALISGAAACAPHDPAAAAAPAPAPPATAHASTQAPLAPAEALAVIEGEAPPQVLDVRSADEFAQGHVPDAVLIPHDELAARLGELDRDRPVLVYCRSGRRSTIAETLLLAEGFQVRQIDGSWLRWQEEKLPVQLPDADSEQEIGE